ncbi:putative prophage phiRv2 integrase [Leucobacter aridicollis]|uniref:tyrosine-type recombinase/integrase n=1 Tax=Leucobacter aridicollis TaxID=283878 RepID=UPI0037C7B806
MAKAWIVDLWVKDAKVTLPDGTATSLSPTSAQLRALAKLPDHFRTAKFGVGSRWRVVWHEEDDAGKQRQRTKHFVAKKDAEALVSELEDDIRTGRYVDPSQREQRYAVVAEAWLSSKARIKDATWRRYRRELDAYILPKWATVRIGAIKRQQIDEWVQQLLAGTAPYDFRGEGKRRPREQGPLAPAYVQHLVGATFGAVLRYAVGEGWLGRNPAAKVELPRAEESEDDLPTLTYAEVELLAAAAAAPRRRKNGREDVAPPADDRLLVLLLAYSGPRIGEATALRVKNLDLDNSRARIARTWTVDRDGRRLLGPPKTWQKRWLPIPPFLVDELRKHVKHKQPEDFVFTSYRGDGQTAIDGGNWYNRVWTRLRNESGVATGFSVHDLRHVAATLAIGAGADVKLVQQMLGHADATETLNTYAHLWPEKTGEVLNLVAARRAEALIERVTEAADEEPDVTA